MAHRVKVCGDVSACTLPRTPVGLVIAVDSLSRFQLIGFSSSEQSRSSRRVSWTHASLPQLRSIESLNCPGRQLKPGVCVLVLSCPGSLGHGSTPHRCVVRGVPSSDSSTSAITHCWRAARGRRQNELSMMLTFFEKVRTADPHTMCPLVRCSANPGSSMSAPHLAQLSPSGSGSLKSVDTTARYRGSMLW